MSKEDLVVRKEGVASRGWNSCSAHSRECHTDFRIATPKWRPFREDDVLALDVLLELTEIPGARGEARQRGVGVGVRA